MYKIVICDDEGKTTIVPFKRSEYSIGRNEGSIIRLTDRNVSRRHAMLSREKDLFFIEDLGSRNGVLVNTNIVGRGPRQVDLEESILIGDYRISISDKDYSSIPFGTQVDPRMDKSVGKVTPYARLVLVNGPHAGMELPLQDELYIVGRGDRANMYIDDPSISRAHARLEGAHDHWVVSDLDSSNGLYINGNKRDDYLLRSADIVEFGNTLFRYVAPREPYDFQYASIDSFQKENGSRAFGIVTTALVVLLILLGGLLIYLKYFRAPTAPTGVTQTTSALDQYHAAMDAGEKQMKVQNWTEAARLFAQAQEMNSETTQATDRKNVAMIELEAEESIKAAKEAMGNEDWSLAVNELSKVHIDSSYFDTRLASRAAERLCEELLYKAEFMMESGEQDVETVLSAIGDIPYVPKRCLDKSNQAQSMFEEAKRALLDSDAAATGASHEAEI